MQPNHAREENSDLQLLPEPKSYPFPPQSQKIGTVPELEHWTLSEVKGPLARKTRC